MARPIFLFVGSHRRLRRKAKEKKKKKKELREDIFTFYWLARYVVRWRDIRSPDIQPKLYRIPRVSRIIGVPSFPIKPLQNSSRTCRELCERSLALAMCNFIASRICYVTAELVHHRRFPSGNDFPKL